MCIQCLADYFKCPKEEIEKLKALMKVASAQLDFEKAIEIRDKIGELRAKMRRAERKGHA